MSPRKNAGQSRKLSRGRSKQPAPVNIAPDSGLRARKTPVDFLQRSLGNAGFAKLMAAVIRRREAPAGIMEGKREGRPLAGLSALQRQEAPQSPSLLEPGAQLTLDPEIEAQMRAMQALRLTLNPTQLRPNLLQVPESLAGSPGPLDLPSLPQPQPLVPAGKGPAKPRAAEASDLLEAVMSVPAIDTAIESLRTQALDRVRTDFASLSKGGKVATVSALAVIAGGSLAGAMTDPQARRFALDQLNGRVLPVPGLQGLGVELNTQGGNIMVGLHLDVGRILPASLGFGPSSPEAIGGPPLGRKAIEGDKGDEP